MTGRPGIDQLLEDAPLVPDDVLAPADPEAPLPVLHQGERRSLGQERGRLAVEDREGGSVEADEPLVGPEPEIAVPRPDDRRHRVLRQPVLGLPDVDLVLAEGPLGIECRRGRRLEERRDGESQEEGSGNPPYSARRAGPLAAVVARLPRPSQAAWPSPPLPWITRSGRPDPGRAILETGRGLVDQKATSGSSGSTREGWPPLTASWPACCWVESLS